MRGSKRQRKKHRYGTLRELSRMRRGYLAIASHESLWRGNDYWKTAKNYWREDRPWPLMYWTAEDIEQIRKETDRLQAFFQ